VETGTTSATAITRGARGPEATAQLVRLRQIFEAVGYTGPAARAALGAELGPSYRRVDLPLYLERLATPTPLNTLIKLFGLFLPVDEAELAAAVAPLEPAHLVALGVVERSAGRARAAVGLSARSGLLLAHDRYDAEALDSGRDHVLGVNAAAVTLESLTVRRQVRSTLDLGCGGGIQALLAARHSEHVIAVDKNPHALDFARFNAAFNGLRNVECRQGDLFEPVVGQRFDLVVCNPPYVVSPESRYTFRDSGRRGDALCEDVVRRAPGHLEEGGFATILCNWTLGVGEEWSAPLRRWVDGSGCDAWLLRGAVQDPLTYAAVWNRGPDGGAYTDALSRWQAYFRQIGAAALGMGAVILRRRTADVNWVRADDLPGSPAEPCGEQIERAFRMEDYIRALGNDARLLDQAFSVAEGHRLRQTLVRRGNDYVVEEAEVDLGGGLAFKGTIDAYGFHLLRQCDGRRPLRHVVAELARMGNVDVDVLAASIPGVVRRLLSLGFLVPADV
jgi:SAM-dependent methyltransferase